jgi:hypothetical protein
MLQLTVESFHPYPDDQLLPLAQAECLQPVTRANIRKTINLDYHKHLHSSPIHNLQFLMPEPRDNLSPSHCFSPLS